MMLKFLFSARFVLANLIVFIAILNASLPTCKNCGQNLGDNTDLDKRTCIGNCGHTICYTCFSEIRDNDCTACPICKKSDAFDRAINNIVVEDYITELKNRGKNLAKDEKECLGCNNTLKINRFAVCKECGCKGGYLRIDENNNPQIKQPSVKGDDPDMYLKEAYQKTLCAECYTGDDIAKEGHSRDHQLVKLVPLISAFNQAKYKKMLKDRMERTSDADVDNNDIVPEGSSPESVNNDPRFTYDPSRDIRQGVKRPHTSGSQEAHEISSKISKLKHSEQQAVPERTLPPPGHTGQSQRETGEPPFKMSAPAEHYKGVPMHAAPQDYQVSKSQASSGTNLERQFSGLKLTGGCNIATSDKIVFDPSIPSLAFDDEIPIVYREKLLENAPMEIGVVSVSSNKYRKLFDVKLSSVFFGEAKTKTKIYIVGGVLGGRPLSCVEEYDCERNEMHALPPLISARGHCAAVISGDRLYVAGGVTSTSNYSNTVEYYDFTAKSWFNAPPLNKARADFVLVEFCGNVFAIGGKCNNEGVLEIEVFNKDANCWAYYGSLQRERAAFSATVLYSTIYIAGGANLSANNIWGCINTMESWVPGEFVPWKLEGSLGKPCLQPVFATLKNEDQEESLHIRYGFDYKLNINRENSMTIPMSLSSSFSSDDEGDDY